MSSIENRRIRLWYWSGAVIIFLILIIGGVTRLTESGLSMVEWRPLTGVLPPLSEQAWQEEFDRYRQYPEYLQRNAGMTLSGFRYIYFWEYLHRLAGRLAGLIFFVPFAWFLARGSFSTKQLRRALLLLVLGTGQGVMGWYMVRSGLVDLPYVSHYRLAAHLMLALLLFGCCVWFALDRSDEGGRPRRIRYTGLQGWIWLFLSLVALQIVWGAFVAGLKAGQIYNTFPRMNQEWLPATMWQIEPLIRNFFDNPVTVQWMHRFLGTVTAVMCIAVAVKAYRLYRPSNRIMATVTLLLVVIQYLLGILVLIHQVPVLLGVLHQAMALVLIGVLVGWIHLLGTGVSGEGISRAGIAITRKTE